MAYSMNKVLILGNLGQDPETRYTPNGNEPVVNLSIATSERWKDRQTGDMQERTEWHRVVFFGKAGQVIADHCRKGEKIQVEGQLRTRKWQDRDGKDRWTTEIIGRDFILLGGNRETGDSGYPARQTQARQPARQQSEPEPAADFYDDDIPF